MGDDLKRVELEVFRTRKQLTQEEMASKLGISRPHYSSIENGKVDPSIELAFKMQEVFGVDDVLNLFKKEE